MFDPSITTRVDFAELRAINPIQPDETRAAFRARAARELFEAGDAWSAYQVLQNTDLVDYFYDPLELAGAYGSVERTAQIVQERYESMLAASQREEQKRREREQSQEIFLNKLRKIRQVLTLGLWK